MRFWWVNQNQTFRQELGGGYVWSPKRNANGARNPFYEAMREIAPGDLIFSFVDTRIKAVGVASSYCYECPKPVEFGQVGWDWEKVGWRAEVAWTRLGHQIRPKDHIALLLAFLPAKYSPLRASGDGLQHVYLTEVPTALADALGALIGPEYAAVLTAVRGKDHSQLMTQEFVGVDEWEEHLQQTILGREELPETTRLQLVRARRGQGLYRKRVATIENACRITGVNHPAHLVASHCKPWRDADDDERLDGENGLLLTPSIDHLFDRGFITFEDDGGLLISPVAHRPSLARLGVEIEHGTNVGGFSSGQKHYLDFHRSSVFLQRR